MKDLIVSKVSLDSREVADMVGKEHSELLKDIRRYIDYLAAGNFPLGEFFTESTYKDRNNQERPNYQITKKGCEFIAHKLTGQKGAVFTAKYINKFHDMEQLLQQPKKLSALEQLRLQYEVVEEHEQRLSKLEGNMTIDYGQQRELQVLAQSVALKIIGGKGSPAYIDKGIRTTAFSQIWKDFKDYFQVSSYRNTPRIENEKAKEYLKTWNPSGKLLREIEIANRQDRIDI
ncbi:phage regulatory protein, rha family [Anaerovirgula multivorans]|uniref:Phage regulatory protein, rha family n=1 Tax=Anaerovirgula multivorans TaxID=312168 RepID=A0A238ZR84_9FIRM|nr:Rha family transcriptional regulator [Anaerovirgula multivorans]SNR85561.1 phage regulatory protein, rha family [Anaerovirgula multivorans]